MENQFHGKFLNQTQKLENIFFDLTISMENWSNQTHPNSFFHRIPIVIVFTDLLVFFTIL